jgi:hypothetical protein
MPGDKRGPQSLLRKDRAPYSNRSSARAPRLHPRPLFPGRHTEARGNEDRRVEALRLKRPSEPKAKPVFEQPREKPREPGTSKPHGEQSLLFAYRSAGTTFMRVSTVYFLKSENSVIWR